MLNFILNIEILTGDDFGRRNLSRLIKDLLSSEKISANLIPQLVHIFTKV